ncbi:MAG: hypothetical protein GWP67_11015 [Gammaproteobacteria bacterium]|jgi:hypothetical protein|nr:hypothetical protein [Gammaproteobacteria bacterium]
MQQRKRLIGLLSIMIGGSGLLSTAAAQDSDAFQWSITPYVWAASTNIDLTVRDNNIGEGDIPFKDLLDTLDAAFMIQVEAGKGNWSAFGDLTYLKTSASNQRTVFTIDIDSKQVFLDAAAAYWPGGFGSPLSIFGGLRYTGFDETYGFSLINGTPVSDLLSDEDYYDALLGVRYRFDFSDRWQLLTHGDVSFGDSEGTYIVRANFAYTVGKREQNRILFGYQYKSAEYRDGDLRKDFTMYGPMMGFDFRF